MLSGFVTGKNKKIALVDENEKFSKIALKLENFDDVEEVKESQSPLDQSAVKRQEEPPFKPNMVTASLYHPNQLGMGGFKIMSRRTQEVEGQSGCKKDSIETVQSNTKRFKQDAQSDFQVTNQKQVHQNKYPIYEMNKVLLAKVKKLGVGAIGGRMKELCSQNIVVARSNFVRREETKVAGFDLKLVRNYFKHNYKYNPEIKKWIKHHSQLIAWKLNSKQSMEVQQLILELEYRHYILNVLEFRTVVQQICTSDAPLPAHYVFLVVNKQVCSNKSIFEISDGWYSLFFICENHRTPIACKIEVGSKLHFTNLYRFPIEFDTSRIEIISQYQYPTMLVTTQMNSIKRAASSAALGRQPEPYFLRSIRSLRSGAIPCLDVFLLSKSYLFQIDGSSKKTIVEEVSESQDTPPEEERKYQFVIHIADTLNYLEKSAHLVSDLAMIYVSQASKQVYDAVSAGMRLRIVNANQVGDKITVAIGRNSGLYYGENLRQFPKATLEMKLNLELFSFEMDIKHVVKERRDYVIQGNSSGVQTTVIVQGSFFEDMMQRSALEGRRVRFLRLRKSGDEQFATQPTSLLQLL